MYGMFVSLYLHVFLNFLCFLFGSFFHLFVLFHSVFFCLFSNDIETESVWIWMLGVMVGEMRIWEKLGRGSHDQTILYEKRIWRLLYLEARRLLR